ncbi:carbon starvation protein A [Marispirochaeta aestuarii]|uniref:Carbon starvation protein A n=1 Tax=Marispirochaeta aestuarii TaxID=1963862 RepID=A0A1Y1S343_9SPIO|nr:carbon starvation protein A [Marispirochaeta aestuarii]ORC38400.1 carbon starvation protein A [Marispirochaeta aestuarii]
MSTLIILVALAIYLVFYFVYGKKLQLNLIKSHEAADAPSKRLSDGVDYIPTSKFVLFGHHFASIAGAGPIVGPALAVAWGWLPGLLWIWFGNIFIGAIHDYLALTASVRYDGRSVQFVAQDLIGKKAGKSFGWFILFLCILIVAAFGDIVAGQFAGDGAVASTFFLFCAAAIVLGILLYRTKLPFSVSTIIGLVLLVAAFMIGRNVGIPASKDTWFLVILVYIFIAAALPVNILLQPRDYLNSFLLYFGLLAGGVAAVIAVKNFDSVPLFTEFSAKVIGGKPSPFWPTVPLVIACGALSGFHALVASGTSSKQLREEKDSLFVGYGAMLTEGFLSTIVVISIAAFGIQALGAGNVLTTGALPRFTSSYGAMVASAMPVFTADFMKLFASIWVSSFALTTLDTTNRLGRYILGELALPLKEKNTGAYNLFQNKWFGSMVVAVLGIGLAWTGNYTVLWPAFSGANQLIASVVMLTVAMWVHKQLSAKYTNIVLIPAILLWVTVTAGLIWYELVIIPGHFATGATVKSMVTGTTVGLITLIMLIMNITMIVSFFRNFKEKTGA